MSTVTNIRNGWRGILFIVIPILLSPILIYDYHEDKLRCAFLVLLMAIYWTAEPIPMAVTSLLPVVLLPILGLATTEEACKPYLEEPNMVFLGSLIFAIAVECSNFHKRIALFILNHIGTRFDKILLGFMFITMFIAMWIINTAAAAMMIPIADAVVDHLLPYQDTTIFAVDNNQNQTCIALTDGRKKSEAIHPLDHKTTKKLRKTLYLLIAYSANIGGTSTLTSNGPNLVLKFIADSRYINQTPVDYTNWLFFAAPPAIISVLLCWLLFKSVLLKNIILPEENVKARKIIKQKYDELGPITFHEISVLILFLTLVSLWMFRDPQFVKGWATYFGDTKPKDATVVIFIVIVLFALPSKPLGPFPSQSLVDWKLVQTKLAWGVILLRGGGFAIANATQSSGLSVYMGKIFAEFNFLPFPVLLIFLSLLTSLITEFASNSATATIVLPVVAQLASNLGKNPLYLMVPITLSCSYAFVLPVGTPANALVFQHAKLKPNEMVVPGFVVKFICLTVMIGCLFFYGDFIFGINTFPSWAEVDLETESIISPKLTHDNSTL